MERDDAAEQAAVYLRDHGARAKAHAEDDRSRAVGRGDLDEVVRLAEVAERIAMIEEAQRAEARTSSKLR